MDRARSARPVVASRSVHTLWTTNSSRMYGRWDGGASARLARSVRMETLPFDAVLCDFDGVVHVWDPDGMTALDRAWGLAEGTLAGAAFEGGLLRAAVTGRLSDEEWRSRIADELTPVCGSAERARDLVAAWTALTGRVDPDVMELLTEVRRTVPVVLLSNATTRLEVTSPRSAWPRRSTRWSTPPASEWPNRTRASSSWPPDASEPTRSAACSSTTPTAMSSRPGRRG